mmetsp:Transcript_63153/g.175095  ORF Transcript_63153/g.175095 Transcript_63153/m.175095 type:complete len:206 (+) Transcript_63153:17-634(+)
MAKPNDGSGPLETTAVRPHALGPHCPGGGQGRFRSLQSSLDFFLDLRARLRFLPSPCSFSNMSAAACLAAFRFWRQASFSASTAASFSSSSFLGKAALHFSLRSEAWVHWVRQTMVSSLYAMPEQERSISSAHASLSAMKALQPSEISTLVSCLEGSFRQPPRAAPASEGQAAPCSLSHAWTARPGRARQANAIQPKRHRMACAL